MAIVGAARAFISVSSTYPAPLENRGGVITEKIDEQFFYTNGTTAGENDLAWSDRGQVLAGATNIIDLTGGGLLGIYGTPLVFAVVTGIIFYNRNAVAGDDINFGPNTALDPFLGPWLDASDLNLVNPASVCYFYSDVGWAVTTNVADKIQITEVGGVNPVDYDILIVGRSA